MKNVLRAILILSSQFCLAQQINVSIKVTDHSNQLPVKQAIVTVKDKVSFTDTLGHLNLDLNKQEVYNFTIEHLGYKSLSSQITIEDQLELVFMLIPISVDLGEILVEGKKDNAFGLTKLKDTEGTAIYAGRKTESVDVESLNSNLASNNSRQVFAKVAGINVFENDGVGTSVGIGGRGLNPSRILNFNTRQNGYDISADPLGYPESYYTTPLNAVEKIEIVRGAASLQYGTQFGGMINYKMKDHEKKKLSGDFSQGIGSFGMFNSFNKLSGTVNKLSYTTFYQYKTYKGWRDRSDVTNHTAFAGLSYAVNSKLTLKGEYTYMNYLAQQAGGLTDAQFNTDMKIVNRQRNWFRVNWNLISVSLDYKLNEQSEFNLRTFGLLADRDALGYLGSPEKIDDTSAYRTLNKDKYTNYGAELRYMHHYKIAGQQNHFLIGGRYYKGKTARAQGNADKTADANFSFLNPDNLENSDYTFPASNYALFAENVFKIGSKYSVVPGLRYEYIDTRAEGYYRLIKGTSDTKVNEQHENSRSFLLVGLGNQYQFNKYLEGYANFSQNYRAINFNDLRITSPTSKVDPNLKDESGYTVDLGFRGRYKNILCFDINGFYMYYNDRIGSASVYDSVSKQTIRYRSNIGNSVNQGIEAYAEVDWIKIVSPNSKHKLATFVNASFVQAIYYSKQINLNKKEVEYAPDRIIRLGISYAYRKLAINLQGSYTSQQFSDSNNTPVSTNGLAGSIPSYTVIDLSATYTYKKFSINAGINNLLNSSYFTRRAEGFPGPGIIPADPINFFATLRYSF